MFIILVQKLTLTCVSGETPQNAIRNRFLTVGTEVIIIIIDWRRSNLKFEKDQVGITFSLNVSQNEDMGLILICRVLIFFSSPTTHDKSF